jgi:hypothetical protein
VSALTSIVLNPAFPSFVQNGYFRRIEEELPKSPKS